MRDFAVDEDGTLLGKEMGLEDLPEVAQRAVLAFAAHDTIATVDRTFASEEVVTFQIALKTPQGRRREFVVVEEGDWVSLELTPEELPPAVRSAILKRAGSDKIDTMDRILVNADMTYHAVVVSKGRTPPGPCAD